MNTSSQGLKYNILDHVIFFVSLKETWTCIRTHRLFLDTQEEEMYSKVCYQIV